MRYNSKNGKSNEPDRANRGRAASDTLATAPAASGERRRPFRRLRLRQRIVPLLVALVLLSACGIVGLAYLGARADAIASAQSRAVEDVRVERQMLVDQGASVTSHDGQLFVGVDNAVLVLNNDSTIVDRTRSLVSGYATIYQLEGDSLVAIATNLSSGAGKSAQGSRALGDTITGPANDALLAQCGPTDASACHHAYNGVVTFHGVSYAAAFEPLTDASGTFVGALGIAIPLDSVLAPTVQFAVMLLLVALLMALIAIVAGSWIFGSISDRVLGALDAQLDVVADATIDLDHLARAQIERAERQAHTARQVSDEVRALNALARTMDEGQSALRESAGEIWGEMSQPGVTPDPAATLRWARQAAVVSGRVGSAAEHVRDLSQHIVTLMNHIVAEGNVVSQRGREMQVCAQELRGSVERVEMTVGERLINRPQGLASIPLLRRIQPASGRLRRMLAFHAPPSSQAKPDSATGQDISTNGDTKNSGRSGALQSKGLTGQQPRIPPARPSHPGSHLNRTGETGQHRTPNTGEWRRSGSLDADSSDTPQRRIPQPSRPRGGSTGQHPRLSSHPPTPPGDPRNRNDLGLPDLPENNPFWHPRNPGDNRWLDED